MIKLIFLFLILKICDAETDTIQDVNQVKLEKLLSTSDYTAVYWYARKCRRSENVLKELETLADTMKKTGVPLVKINDKRLGKGFGIQKFPALSFFREREIILFEGDLKDKSAVLEFLTDEDNLAMPDNIEEVDADTLLKTIEQEDLVAVFFYDESKTSAKALENMENIDDETDIFNIRFLRIKDAELAEDFSLSSIPALVFFRYEIPVVYEGDLNDELEVLEWLINERTGADEQDMLEFVTEAQLEIMVETVDHLLILFLDNSRMSNKVLDIMETIDDDCDGIGVSFVAVRDRALAARYSIDDFPSLVYFEQEIPSVFDGDLEDTKEVLAWVVHLVESADIEEVTNDILDKFIATRDYLAVLFFKDGDESSLTALQALEEIDDDLDSAGIMFVKIDDEKEAEEYGIDNMPALVVFENGIPNVYDGNIADGEDVLDWIITESSGDHTIESVTDNMLDTLVSENDHVAVVFYDKHDQQSKAVLESLEHIDDEAVNFQFPIKLLKMADLHEAQEYGITTLPALVYFDKLIPNIYSGNLLDNQEILTWMTEQASGSHIEDISSQILEKLIRQHEDVAVFFYSKKMKGEARLLEDLELVDHILENEGIPLVRLDDQTQAERSGLQVVPGLVHFQYKEPHVYKGDLSNERKILDWVLETRNT